MGESILDGTGSSFKAKVDSDNKLEVRSITRQEEEFANAQGDAYNINTGLITLTDAVDTPVLYLKNNETNPLSIAAVAIGVGPSTGGSSGDMVYTTFIRNPTTGTIIDNATATDINSNRNYTSAATLGANTYKGATGNTMTNGEDHILAFLGTSGRSFLTINELLPRGGSFGIKIKPQTSNTSMQIYAAVICYLERF
jgi:hypothetical protein